MVIAGIHGALFPVGTHLTLRNFDPISGKDDFLGLDLSKLGKGQWLPVLVNLQLHFLAANGERQLIFFSKIDARRKLKGVEIVLREERF